MQVGNSNTSADSVTLLVPFSGARRAAAGAAGAEATTAHR
jgi:hypothetical protein